ncbi:subclass B3 metallo-beta-lactamase [Tahibacter amnicola]|uniref:Subclass B3 metallo-beta-lactamase n=1 Tax=Tahibacter amnicola TaxID=2976241 RepID=A0ABY6B926_9GAMM|nr:subclass B3 metallo-beta-lactamase [Tahibacter amnicola]UXI66561.1 subclass B3 metallo-beta-lactamase [Tahibacter amnicola]
MLTMMPILAVLAGATPATPPENTIPPSWSQPHKPFRVHGDTYYVGSQGLTALLITSPKGHVLIDVPMAENADLIEANIRSLGFKIEDVRIVLNSHAHHDHAGGIAKLVRDSGAVVHASAHSAVLLKSGGDDASDPQHGLAATFPAVSPVSVVADGETIRIGPNAFTAHATPGHTPGSTTWTWQSCEGEQCLEMVYADSLTAMGAPSYRYGDPAHPHRVADFRRGLEMLKNLPCDLLITPHPEASGFFERIARKDRGEPEALHAAGACRSYAEGAADRLEKRLADEQKSAGAMP